MKNLQLPIIPLACLALAACGGAATPSTQPISGAPPPSSQFATVKLASNVPGANYAPLYIAMDKGYFKDVGVSVDYQVLADIEGAAALLSSGQLDAGILAPSAALFNAANRGVDTRIVSGMGVTPASGNPAALMVRKDLVDSGQVASPADLRGRRISLALGKTGTLAYLTDLVLQPVGLSLKDVEVVNLANPDAVGALKNRAVDATFIPAPWTTQLAQQGIATLLAGSPNRGHSGVATVFGGKFMRERPEVARAVLEALMRGSRDL